MALLVDRNTGRPGAGRHARAAAGSGFGILLSVAATTMMATPVVVITLAGALPMVVTGIVNRPQEVVERLRRNVSPLLPRRRVREAEMNPNVDASVDHVVGQV